MLGSTFVPGGGKSSDIIGASISGGTVPALSTYYSLPFGATLNPLPWISPWARAGKISKLVISTANAQPASGSLEIVVTKNAVITALKITIPANGVAAFYTNTVDSFSIAYGDFLGWNFKNNAAAASAVMTGVGMLIEY